MQKKESKKYFVISFVVSVILLIVISGIYLFYDLADNWENLSNDNFVIKDYLFLVIFNITIYCLVPLALIIGKIMDNKKSFSDESIKDIVVTSFEVWLFTVLIVKLVSETIFEIDQVFKIYLFDKINDFQLMIGYLLTLLFKIKVEVKPDHLYIK